MAIGEVIVRHDHFDRALTLSTTPEGGTGWTIKDTSANGTPTYAAVDGSATGEIKLLCDNTSEQQILTLYQNNILQYDIDQIQLVKWRVKTGGWDNVSDLVVGIAGDQNNTEDSVAQNAWFKIDGSASTTNIVVESDDGTNDNDDKATGQTLSTTYKDLIIDFQEGTDDVRFYVDNGDGQLVRVASTVTFDMSNYTGSVQPFIQLNKASGTGVPSVSIDEFYIRYKRK